MNTSFYRALYSCSTPSSVEEGAFLIGEVQYKSAEAFAVGFLLETLKSALHIPLLSVDTPILRREKERTKKAYICKPPCSRNLTRRALRSMPA
jgi:hypothetical protein